MISVPEEKSWQWRDGPPRSYDTGMGYVADSTYVPEDDLQLYLRKYGERGPEALAEEYGVHVKEHPVLKGTFIFTYDQIFSPRVPLVDKCRGCLMTIVGDAETGSMWWAYVGRGPSRFYNVSEGPAQDFPWDQPERISLLSKEDGTLVNLRYTNFWSFEDGNLDKPLEKRWLVSTKGSPDASGRPKSATGEESKETYADLFWRAFRDEVSDPVDAMLARLDKECTYSFELVGPQTEVVSRYSRLSIVLLNIRNTRTGQEQLPIDTKWCCCFRTPQYTPMGKRTLSQVLEEVGSLNPLEEGGEGFVAVADMGNGVFRRCKIKNKKYVELHHMRDQLTDKGLFGIILTGEIEEYAVYFPEALEKMREIESGIDRIARQADTEFAEVSALKLTQKEYAAKVLGSPFKDFLFQSRRVVTEGKFDGKMTFKDYWRKMYDTKPIKAYETYVENKG